MSMHGQSLQQFYSRPFAAGARATSLGDAYVAETEDGSAFYWNPASLSFIPSQEIVSSFALNWALQESDNSIALPFHLADGQTLVIGAASTLYGDQWSQPYFVNQGIDIGYARNFTSTLSIGVLSNLRYGNSAQSSLFAGSAAIGVLYFPSPGISYGLVLKNIGSGIVFSYQSANGDLSYEKNLPRSLTIGSTFRYPSTSVHPYICVSMDSELLLGLAKFRNKAGLEIQPWEFLALRFGGLTADLGNVLRFGIGLQFNSFQLDYGVSPSLTSERFHQLSLAVHIGKN